jgi:two-component system, LuxR family, response regulator FixJ
MCISLAQCRWPVPAEAVLNAETTIYVIDDDDAVCDSLRVLLELRGLSVATYGSAEAFLSDSSRPGQSGEGCILLDLDLPGMGGLDLLRLLRRDGSRLPVIVITGRGVPAVEQAEEAGALAILEKPFLDRALMSCIDRALRHA